MRYLALLSAFLALPACPKYPKGGDDRVAECRQRWDDCATKSPTKEEGLACITKVDEDPRCADFKSAAGGGAP